MADEQVRRYGEIAAILRKRGVPEGSMIYVITRRIGAKPAGRGLYEWAPIEDWLRRTEGKDWSQLNNREGNRGAGNVSTPKEGIRVPKKVYKEEVQLTREEVSRRTGISQSEVPRVLEIMGAGQDDKGYAESLVSELIGNPEILKSRVSIKGEKAFFGFLRYRVQQLSEFLPVDAVNFFTSRERTDGEVRGWQVVEFFYRNGNWENLARLGYERNNVEQRLAGDRRACRTLYGRAGPSI